jgi:hypothetical protein
MVPITMSSNVCPDLKLSFQFNELEKHQWQRVVAQFDDASIYQSWSYGFRRWKDKHLTHVLVGNGVGLDGIVAAAQVVTVTIPGTKIDVSHVKAGPLWLRRGTSKDLASYRQLVRGLREHFVVKKRSYLRIQQRMPEAPSYEFQNILESEGYSARHGPNRNKTWLINLSQPLPTLHANLKRNWRYYLRKSDQQSLSCDVGTEIERLDFFLDLYADMKRRKKFRDPVELNILRVLHQELPENEKFRVIFCYRDGQPAAALVLSVLGGTGIAHFGVTTPLGRAVGASYYLDWWVVKWLKERGYAWYDLGGAAASQVNVYKSGLTGKRSRPTQWIRDFDASPNVANSIAVAFADRVRSTFSGFG